MAADFYVTADGGSEGSVSGVCKGIESEGKTTESGVTGPNAEALRNNGTVKPPTKLVFICNGGQAGQTYGSFAQNYQDGMCFTIFAFDNYNTHFDNTTEKGTRELPLVSEHDSGSFATSEIAQDIEGHTSCSYQQKYPDVMAFISDETSAESLGKRIAKGDYTCGAGDGGGTTSSSGGGAQIKDKTFEHCIRRICAATDSVFIVENNAAVLFPYTDWMAFTLRRQVNQIRAKDIDPDLFEMNYNTEGFYNKVTVVWGADEEQEPTTSDQENEEEKKTVGNVTTVQKSMPTGGTQMSEQYDSLVEIYGELEKKVTTNFPNEETAHFVMNALLIQYIRDFNNSCRARIINNQKFIGGTFYAVENPNTNESELFYLNSYTMFKEKNQPLVSDMEFKYGPEGAEELLDYQTYGGGGAASSGNVNSDEPQSIKELVNQACQGITDPTQKMIAVHNYLKDRITYLGYNCSHYSSPDECLQHLDGLNCADTSRLTRSCMSAAGLDSEVVYRGANGAHFWTIITINGKEHASDAVSAYHELGDVWQASGTAHFDDGGPYEKKCGKNPHC